MTGPVLNRIWTFPGSKYAEKLKHSIEPFFNVERVSSIDNFDQIVQIDSTDTIVRQTTRLGYGVANRLYRKPAGDGQSREILNATIGQSYYTDARAAHLRPLLPDQLQRHRAEQLLTALDRGAGGADRSRDREFPRRVRHAVPRVPRPWPPTAPSTGGDGCRRPPGGASAASSQGLQGSTIPAASITT